MSEVDFDSINVQICVVDESGIIAASLFRSSQILLPANDERHVSPLGSINQNSHIYVFILSPHINCVNVRFFLFITFTFVL